MKDFDELLDEVLHENRQVKPRLGLETRVLARLQGESKSRNRWRSWMLVPAAACLGVVATVWFVAGRRVPQYEAVISQSSAQLTQKTETGSRESGRTSRDAHLTSPARKTGQGPRLRDDKAVAKMGHPVVVVPKMRPSAAAFAQQKRLPKLEMFPAVTQKGDVVGWWSSDDEGKLATIARESSPATVTASQELRSVQDRPIDIAAIEIKPLQ